MAYSKHSIVSSISLIRIPEDLGCAVNILNYFDRKESLAGEGEDDVLCRHYWVYEHTDVQMMMKGGLRFYFTYYGL